MNIKRLLWKIYYNALLFKKKALIAYTDAEKILTECYDQKKPCFEQRNVMNKRYDLMIVIPVYNVERYLDECLQSVLAQKTKYSFSVVIVNDGSTDGSGKILDCYADRENFTVIHQENRGHSGARNRALETITGKYVMFLDADDYLAENAVEVLLQAAFEKDADLVAGGYAQFNESGVFNIVQYEGETKKVSASTIPGYTCMKVFRADLMENFCFPEGMLFEDTVLPRLVFPLCENTYTVPQVVYYYRQHAEAFSTSHHRQARCLDTYWITKYCLEEASRRGYVLDSQMYEQYLQQCWVNFLRTQYLSQEVQEAMFILTADLMMTHYENVKCKGKYKLLDKALKKKNYAAYQFVMQRWVSI